MTDRYLITTADERTWKFDRPVLFLGEWCRCDNRKHVWSNMNFEVASPYGLHVGQVELDMAYIQSLSSQLLKELTNALNVYHKTSYGLRYWHIILGNWLKNYIRVIYNRYFTLEQAMANYTISRTAVFNYENYSLASYDCASFNRMSNESVWNNIIYGKILYFWNYKDVDFLAYPGQTLANLTSRCNVSFGHRVKQLVINIWNNVFHRKHDAFIINSYLPKKEELKLQLLLKQIPQIWYTVPLRIVRSEANKRKYFNINVDHCDGFEKFVRQLLPEIIPTCYLEGYSQLIEQVESLSWPTDPRFIFTGSNFDSDEIFKAWTASKANLGVPYYISQHGSDQTAIGYPPWPELIYCNKYFTWGWRNESQKIVPMFNFKIIKRRHVHKKIRDKLLLIQFHSPHLYGPEDLYYKIKVYRDIQFRFVDMLHSYIQEKLIVRLYHAHDPHDELIWQERFPNIYIEPGKANINELKNNSKIVVHSYDSTGIPESLGLNMPMVFLWAGKLSNIFPKAKPYYEKLRDAGIFADTPEQAAELVSLYWNDVDKWWNSKKVQDARKMFCDNYGRVVAKPLRLLKQHLLHDLNKEKY